MGGVLGQEAQQRLGMHLAALIARMKEREREREREMYVHHAYMYLSMYANVCLCRYLEICRDTGGSPCRGWGLGLGFKKIN